jgi:hypothetical protein
LGFTLSCEETAPHTPVSEALLSRRMGHERYDLARG